MSRSPSIWLVPIALLAFYVSLASAVTSEKPLGTVKKPQYTPGQAIPISCLNRTIDTGEHVSDEKGQLQYIPFPTCNETGRPLELHFGVEKDINCTIPFITDEFFHLLEFYIHSDAPLSCRIPARPLLSSSDHEIGPSSSTSRNDYIPMIFALTGTLALSHLKIATTLNLLLHAAPLAVAPGVIDAATAYSVSPLRHTTRTVIGDPLPLRLSVRWYPTTTLPSGWRGVGGHLYFSTIVYCLLCIGATAAGCLAYFRGVEMPRRLRGYGAERLGGAGEMGGGGAMSGGYGYGVVSANGNSNGFGGGGGYGFPGVRGGLGKSD